MNMEWNKLAAAILVAGIAALGSGVISHHIFDDGHDDAHAEKAYPIEGVESEAAPAAGTAAKNEPEPILALLATASAETGATVAKKCATCHDFTKGGPNKVGPNLWNIVNAKKAHIDSFAYSATLKGMAGQWGYDELNHFLWKPQSYAKGTKMAFAGISKPEERAAVIAYLRTLADSPAPLPATPKEKEAK